MRFQPQVNNEEAANLAAFLGIPLPELLSRYAQETYIGHILKHGEEGCVFLRREADSLHANCSVYQARPDACKEWQAGPDKLECREGLALFRAAGIFISWSN